MRRCMEELHVKELTARISDAVGPAITVLVFEVTKSRAWCTIPPMHGKLTPDGASLMIPHLVIPAIIMAVSNSMMKPITTAILMDLSPRARVRAATRSCEATVLMRTKVGWSGKKTTSMLAITTDVHCERPTTSKIRWEHVSWETIAVAKYIL